MHIMLTAHDQQMYITIKFRCKVEYHKGNDVGTKGQYPWYHVPDKRPSPWPLSRVHFPLKANRSNVFPSIPDVSLK